MTKRKQYDLTDLLIAILTTELRKEVNRLDVIGFDELSAGSITRLTKEMITRLLKSNKREYIKIVHNATEEAKEDLEALGLATALTISADGKYVDKVLKEYNPVTGYLYNAEADRKRARLAEALITAVLIKSRNDYHEELRKFANLWHTQTLQYGETMVDKARLDTFKKNGIKRVKWVSEHDNRVCEECKERDGKVYPINAIPVKPHYRCRCWIEPLKENGNNGK
jgi:SPP1 gp7 family putative phage head morphogenesis protein